MALSSSTFTSKCRAVVEAYAVELAIAVHKKRLNKTAISGLLRSRLEAPAFSSIDRKEMLRYGVRMYERELIRLTAVSRMGRSRWSEGV